LLVLDELPGAVVGAKRQHAAGLHAEQPSLQLVVLDADAVADDNLKPNTRGSRLLDEFPGKLGLRSERGVRLALSETRSRKSGSDAQGDVTFPVGPVTRDGDDSVCRATDPADVLLGGERDPVTTFPIARFIDHERVLGVESQV
jgi:hypothetical protein